MNSKRFMMILILVVGLLLTLSVGLGAARVTHEDTPPADPAALDAVVNLKIPVQGRLTKPGGIPLDGDYNIAFRVYDKQTGGPSLCSETKLVSVDNGLFNTDIKGCTPAEINGKQLYLGVEVESDGEMTPRQPLYPVPYAYSLVQGAELIGDLSIKPMFEVRNSNNLAGTALHGNASASSGSNIGVMGSSNAKGGYGGYFVNNATGGTALKAAGTGKIQSSAKTYLFAPGSDFRRDKDTDTTRYEIEGAGVKIARGGVAGNKYIWIPFTMPAVLYGQPVRITEIKVYYKCPDADNYISQTQLYVQTDADSKNTLISASDEFDDHFSITADDYTYSTISSKNLLSKNAGPVTVVLRLDFGFDNKWIHIGGVRLTLEHD